jgi:cadherin 5 type 2 (VE-cadherin)
MLVHSFCSEFDKYQVSISVRRQAPVTRMRGEPTMWEFKENLEPGRSYQVVVKTLSGKVTSWPATGNVTLSKYTVTVVTGKLNTQSVHE